MNLGKVWRLMFLAWYELSTNMTKNTSSALANPIKLFSSIMKNFSVFCCYASSFYNQCFFYMLQNTQTKQQKLVNKESFIGSAPCLFWRLAKFLVMLGRARSEPCLSKTSENLVPSSEQTLTQHD